CGSLDRTPERVEHQHPGPSPSSSGRSQPDDWSLEPGSGRQEPSPDRDGLWTILHFPCRTGGERARPEQAVVVVDLPPVSEAKVCECLRTIPGPLKVYTVR